MGWDTLDQVSSKNEIELWPPNYKVEAPTPQELLENMPARLYSECLLEIINYDSDLSVSYGGEYPDEDIPMNKNLAEALAQLLLCLHKDNHLEE